MTQLTVTATLDGKALDAAATVAIAIDPASVATRDLDYSALFNPSLIIPAGSTSGSLTLLLDPTADSEDEGTETITLNGSSEGLTGDSAHITLADAGAVTPPPPPEATPLAFADGTSIADQKYTAGTAITALELPAASGGTGDIVYSMSALPAGLSFDAATRTISGTPQAEGSSLYTYTVTDATGESVAMLLHTRPAEFSLASNYPNPFNPATTIQYALPHAADVQLTVYNVVGQVVRTLVAEHQSAGRYLVAWDATDDSGHSLSAGIYFYRLQAGGEFHAAKKMLLLK